MSRGMSSSVAVGKLLGDTTSADKRGMWRQADAAHQIHDGQCRCYGRCKVYERGHSAVWTYFSMLLLPPHPIEGPLFASCQSRQGPCRCHPAPGPLEQVVKALRPTGEPEHPAGTSEDLNMREQLRCTNCTKSSGPAAVAEASGQRLSEPVELCLGDPWASGGQGVPPGHE